MTQDFRIHQAWPKEDAHSRIVETVEIRSLDMLGAGKVQEGGEGVWDGRSLARAEHEMRPLEKVAMDGDDIRRRRESH